MIGELFLVAIAFVGTVVLGAPIAARMARIQVFGRGLPADAQIERPPARTAYFEPVDFGPDSMRWPSEVDRPDEAIPQPEWPSARWDDTHFGRGKSAAAREAFAAAEAGDSRRRHREASEEQPASAPQQQAPPQPRVASSPQQDTAPPQPERQRAPAPQARQAASPAPQQPGQASQEDVARAIEQLVAQHGLAGAVQQLMQQQGWDFRTAAKFLADNRRR